MLRFDLGEWIAAKKQEFALETPTRCKIFVSCIAPVQLSIDGIPVKSGNEFTLDFVARGLLELRSTEKFGAKCEFRSAQTGEPFDTKEVVALAVQGNALAQLRQAAAREAHRARQHHMDVRSWNSEIDEDDFRFEEDILDAAAAASSGPEGQAADQGGDPPENKDEAVDAS